MRSLHVGIVLALALSGAAFAARPAKAPGPVAPPVNPPQVSVTIDATAPAATWRLRVRNTGALPLRFVADVRLLSLEIAGGDGGAPVRCALPGDARPATDTERVLILPPGRAWSEELDPRLFCFGARAEKALVAGATVTAHLGWYPAKATTVPPFVLSPPESDRASTADAGAWPTPVKEISCTPFVLPAEPASTHAPAGAAEEARLSVRMNGRVDGGVLFDETVVLTVKNDGIRPERVFAQPSTIAFDLSGPGGTRRCALGVAPVAVRDLVTTLGAGATTSVSVALDRICGPGMFDRAGVYRVVPVLDTRRVTPPPGVRIARGQWTGEAALVRVRTGKLPDPAPRLDPREK